jgi:hypothetical protein
MKTAGSKEKGKKKLRAILKTHHHTHRFEDNKEYKKKGKKGTTKKKGRRLCYFPFNSSQKYLKS